MLPLLLKIHLLRAMRQNSVHCLYTIINTRLFGIKFITILAGLVLYSCALYEHHSLAEIKQTTAAKTLRSPWSLHAAESITNQTITTDSAAQLDEAQAEAPAVVTGNSEKQPDSAGAVGTAAKQGTTNRVTSDFYEDPFAEQSSTPSFTSLWLRLMGILLLFALLAYLLLRFVKSRQRQQEKPHPLYKVVASFPLAMNKSIKIIKVVHDYYIVAVTQDNIALLRRLDDKASLDELKLHENSAQLHDAPAIPLFGDIFKLYAPVEKRKPLNITRKLRERLKNL